MKQISIRTLKQKDSQTSLSKCYLCWISNAVCENKKFEFQYDFLPFLCNNKIPNAEHKNNDHVCISFNSKHLLNWLPLLILHCVFLVCLLIFLLIFLVLFLALINVLLSLFRNISEIRYSTIVYLIMTLNFVVFFFYLNLINRM